MAGGGGSVPVCALDPARLTHSHIGEMKHLSILTIALCASALAKEPVITKEIREENGKQVEYMFIDDVKVHEEDPAREPQPKIVTPKPYDAEAAKAPEGATVLSTAPRKPWKTGRA